MTKIIESGFSIREGSGGLPYAFCHFLGSKHIKTPIFLRVVTGAFSIENCYSLSNILHSHDRYNKKMLLLLLTRFCSKMWHEHDLDIL